MIVVVMGVSGVGKTAVGRALAEELEAAFLDADDFHPPENVRKMSRGEPLTDADRWPWLDRLHAELRRRSEAGERVVLACSALRAAYRERLAGDIPAVRWLHLRTDAETIRRRMGTRTHFMPASLLQSQFDALEAPADAATVDAGPPLREVVRSALRALRGPGAEVDDDGTR